jgi:hypothetical protein
MRQKREAVLAFEWDDRGLPKIVREFCAKYKALSQVLNEHPKILDAVHEDLKELSAPNRKGRKGDYPSENLFRALVVMVVEGLDYRETVVRIGGDLFLQEFVRLRKKPVMDFVVFGQVFFSDPAGDLAAGQPLAGRGNNCSTEMH